MKLLNKGKCNRCIVCCTRFVLYQIILFCFVSIEIEKKSYFFLNVTNFSETDAIFSSINVVGQNMIMTHGIAQPSKKYSALNLTTVINTLKCLAATHATSGSQLFAIIILIIFYNAQCSINCERLLHAHKKQIRFKIIMALNHVNISG